MPNPVRPVLWPWPVRITAGFMTACLAAGLPSALAESRNDQWTVATPWTGPAGITLTTKQIMTVQAQTGPTIVARYSDAGTSAIDRTSLPMNPASTAVSGWNCNPPPCTSEPAVSTSIQAAEPITTLDNQGFGLSFTAITYTETAVNPPSPSGAAGANEFLLAANGRIRSFDKTTGNPGAMDADLAVFFNSVNDGSGIRDPRLRFDVLTGRFFVLATTASRPNRIVLAVSDGPAITASTVWTFFYFRQDEVSPAGDLDCYADYPTLGIDANALYIGANQYAGSVIAENYRGSAAFVIRKANVLNGGPIVVSAFRNLTNGAMGTGPFAPQGVDNLDAGATQGYLIGVDVGSLGTLMLRRINDPGGTPLISANVPITVPTTYPPIDVPHKGNIAGPNGNLSAFDDRLSASHIRNGHLWTAHNIGVNSNGIAYNPPSRVAVRWYDLSGLNSTPFVVRSGTVYDSSSVNPLFYWIPSLMSTGQGRTGFTFNIAGYNSYVDAAAASLLWGGDVQTPARYTNSVDAYNPSFDPGGYQGRVWGKHSSISLDPADNATLWAVQQFVAGPNTWGIRVTQMLAPEATLDQVVYHACAHQTDTTFYLTGSGFYDPGPGYAQPTLAIDGPGVIVTDFQVMDPHTASFAISIDPDYAVGQHSIIYTSADGQSSMLYNGLFVHGGRADFTQDCRVDTDDALIFFACSTGPGVLYDTAALPAGCTGTLTNSGHLPADFDDDFDVDNRDFAVFQRCFTGPDHYITMDLECRWGL